MLKLESHNVQWLIDLFCPLKKLHHWTTNYNYWHTHGIMGVKIWHLLYYFNHYWSGTRCTIILGLWGYSKTCLGMWTTFLKYVWCKFYLFELMFGFLDSNFMCSSGFLALWLNVQLLIEFISFWFCKLLFNFVGSRILQVFHGGFVNFGFMN
jgi:hypothetical protein